MGTIGNRLTTYSPLAAEEFVRKLKPQGEVSVKEMFEGFGIFEGGSMFARVKSNGRLFLNADDSNRKAFETAGSEQHGRMPYFSVPGEVLERDGDLREWARQSIEAAHWVK